VKKEDIDIEFNDTVLVLSGQHRRDPSTTSAQDINVKHDRTDQQTQERTDRSPEPADYKPNQYPQSNQYQQKPPNENQPQQQPSNGHQPQQPQTEYQQPPQQQPSNGYQPQPPQTEYQQQPQQQQSTEHQSSQQYNQQQPAEYHKIKKPHHSKDDEDYEKIHIQERRYGYFSRSIQLPSNIRNDVDIHAKLENGVLRVKIPKSNERPKRKISIL